MRQFKHPNMHGFKCPVCKTDKDLPIVLVPLEGTEDDSGNIEVKQVHTECFRLWCKMRDFIPNIEDL